MSVDEERDDRADSGHAGESPAVSKPLPSWAEGLPEDMHKAVVAMDQNKLAAMVRGFETVVTEMMSPGSLLGRLHAAVCRESGEDLARRGMVVALARAMLSHLDVAEGNEPRVLDDLLWAVDCARRREQRRRQAPNVPHTSIADSAIITVERDASGDVTIRQNDQSVSVPAGRLQALLQSLFVAAVPARPIATGADGGEALIN